MLAAGAVVSVVPTELGGGLTAFDIYIDDPDNVSLSYFVTNFQFTGPINQVKFNGTLDVNDNALATTLDGLGGYSKITDSYFFTPWTNNLAGTGIVQTGGSYQITAGTGGGSQYDFIQLARIVASGDVTYSGLIAHNSVQVSVSGTLNVNAPPTAGISGPSSVARDATATYTLTASDSPADLAAGFTFDIDWGDGSPIQQVTGLSGTQVTHTFSTVGQRTVSVTATDQHNATGGAATTGVTVSAVQLQPNSQNGALTDLVWFGTGGADHVTFQQDGLTNTIFVTTTLENGLATSFVETFTGITGIVRGVGLGGDDTLDASAISTKDVGLDGGIGNNTLYGGGGNDTLIGGANFGVQVNGPEGQQGSNIIVGGAGNDTIYGNWTDGGEGGGRNILVGGDDNDSLFDYTQTDGAEGKGSILIDGKTNASLTLADLQAIMSEWASTNSYGTRVNNILNGGGFNGAVTLQPGGNVTTDAAVDQLWGATGGTGLNWFWYSLALDTVNRAKAGETHTTL